MSSRVRPMPLTPVGAMTFASDGSRPTISGKVFPAALVGHVQRLSMGRGWEITCEVTGFDPLTGEMHANIVAQAHTGPEPAHYTARG